jgi:hypothetical protein
MDSSETILSGPTIRSLELHKVAERRRAAGLLAPAALADLVLRWVRDQLLPPEAVVEVLLRLIENRAFEAPDGSVDCDALRKVIQHCLEELGHNTVPEQTAGRALHLDALARLLVRRLDQVCLEPEWLAKTIQSWTRVGALPPEARPLNDGVLQHLSSGRFLTELREVLRDGDVEKCVTLLRELKDSGRLGLPWIAARRRAAGLVPKATPEDGDDPDTNFEFLLRGEFLAGEGRAQTACRSLRALQDTITRPSDKSLSEAVAWRNEPATELPDNANVAQDLEILVLEALVLEVLSQRELREQTTGLALSGGGLRSASFNLGLLQALHRGGLLRWMDYLSTVSGGTYIGAWLSARIAQRDKPIGREEDFRPLSDRRGGGEGDAVRRLIRAGCYLNHPLVFTSRYVFGLLTINLILLSFLLLGCVVVAGAWRLLDEPPVCEAILVLTGGIVIEAYRPFMVAAVLLLAWLLGWALSASRKSYASRPLRYGVLLVLLALTAGWPMFEWHGRYLNPDHPLWRLVRPLPLLLLLAWLLAWQVIAPSVPTQAPSRTWRWQVARFSLGLMLPLVTLWGAWRLVESRLDLPYGVEVAGTLLLVALSVVWIGRCLLQLALTQSAGTPTPFQVTKRLEWLLLLSGVAFLVGWAVWLATPSINLIPTTSTAYTAPDAGTLEQHRTWLYPLLASLLVSLVPFLSPRRLLESGTQPKRSWEPWLFRIACVGAVIGIPLLGVHFFARHNLSGYNTVRSVEILPGEFDLSNFFQQVKQDIEEENEAHAKAPAQAPVRRLLQALFTRQGEAHAKAPGQAAEHASLVGAWEELNRRQTHFCGYLTTVNDIVRDEGLGRVLRQQPVPLSQLADAKKHWVVAQVNDVLFQAPSPRQYFHRLLDQQQQIQEGKGEKTRQWAAWPKIREMLHQLDETRPNTPMDEKDRKDLAQRITRSVLEAGYQVTDKDIPRRPIVIDWDQLTRLACLVLLLALCGMALGRARLNFSSLHFYYRDQLAWAFLAQGRERPGEPAGEQQRSLSTLDTTRKGGPYQLINATLNALTIPELILKAFGKSEKSAPTGSSELTDCFVFGRDFVGSDTCGYAWTRDYEKTSSVRLRDAIALSGAAVSLTQIDNPLLLLMMTALNLRLGQWLPSPRHSDHVRPPTLYQLLMDAEDAGSRRYFFISDGGHHDNLGLDSLLMRRCRLIIVSDVTCDPGYDFLDFCRVCRLARRQDGVEIVPLNPACGDGSLPLDEVRPQKYLEGATKTAAGGREKLEGCARSPAAAGQSTSTPEEKQRKKQDLMSAAHYFLARLEYPRRSKPRASEEDGQPLAADIGYLIYLKPSITGDEPADLKGHWRDNPVFPHDPTSNQFYSEEMVDSYRQLGEHIGERLCVDLAAAGGRGMWDFDALQFERVFTAFFQAAERAVAPPERARPELDRPGRSDIPVKPEGAREGDAAETHPTQPLSRGDSEDASLAPPAESGEGPA